MCQRVELSWGHVNLEANRHKRFVYLTELGVRVAIQLREITKDNLNSILKLKVSESQNQFVATNAVSIAQGTYEEKAWFRGIFDDDEPVGFVMLELEEETGDYYLWRYMIAEQHQGKGYGKTALVHIINMVKGLPNAKTLSLSYVPADGSPRPFYQKLGFAETGEVEEGERVMKLDF